MTPQNVHVTLLDGFVLYKDMLNRILRIGFRGYADRTTDRIVISSPKYLKHELLEFLICETTGSRSSHCEDETCYCYPYSSSTLSGICDKHKQITESKLSGARIGLDVSIYTNSDPQKLEGELRETLEDFKEKTSITAHLNEVRVHEKSIKDKSWLVVKNDTEHILPPMDIETLRLREISKDPTTIFLMRNKRFPPNVTLLATTLGAFITAGIALEDITSRDNSLITETLGFFLKNIQEPLLRDFLAVGAFYALCLGPPLIGYILGKYSERLLESRMPDYL
jgi:hypothetical protein